VARSLAERSDKTLEADKPNRVTQVCAICTKSFETEYPFPPNWIAKGWCWCSLSCMEKHNEIHHNHICGRDPCGPWDDEQ